jgi:aminoglycoside phosphotransferase (APT) family kinase protein
VIGHSDFNPGNILVNGKIVFIDWSAAHVGGPWLTLEYLIAHFKRMGAALHGQDTLLRQIFREQWLPIIPHEVLRQAQHFTPLVAVFASAVADDGWKDPATLSLPGVAGYLRSLSRIMWREAQSLNARRAYA